MTLPRSEQSEDAVRAMEWFREVTRGHPPNVALAVVLRAQGWGQEEIARELTVGQSTVSRWFGLIREASGGLERGQVASWAVLIVELWVL